MAEIDPLVAEVLLKGDDEFLSSLKKIGSEAVESFEKLGKSVEASGESAASAASRFGIYEAALAGIAAATIDFIEKQLELSQATKLLADSFGTTGEQLQQIEGIFAASGVKVEQFERFAVRLTTTIAREWPAIAESIRNYATENDAATLRVQSSILRIKDAQNAVNDNAKERAAQANKDNTSLELSYIRLGFAAQKAALEQRGAALSVSGAVLGVVAAQQRLDELQGKPVSAADKEKLAISQAQQAVDQARKAEADARLAQQEKLAEAALKQQQAEQAADDLARKIAKNRRDDDEQRLKDENAVKAAIIARQEAEEKAAKLATTNIASVRGALDSIVSGNKDVSGQVDLTQVSIENLRKSIIALAAETSKKTPPTGFETLRAASKLFTSDTEHQISTEQRLAVVTRLAGSSFASLGTSAAELLHVLENSSEEFDKMEKFVSKNKNSIDANAHTIEEFKGALASLNLVVSQLSQAFAAAIAPAFTEFLKSIRESLVNSDGVLHTFIEGIKGIKDGIVNIGQTALAGADAIAAFLNKISSAGSVQVTGLGLVKAAIVGIGLALTIQLGLYASIPIAITAIVYIVGYLKDHWTEVTAKVAEFKGAIIAASISVAAFALLLAPIPVAIGLIVAAAVLVYTNWDNIKQAVADAWKVIQDTSGYKFLESVVEKCKEIYEWFVKLKDNTPQWLGGGGGRVGNTNQKTLDEGNAHTGLTLAGGGEVHGPGSPTSDSVFAKLSNGEFVQNAAAVAFWGTDFMHKINNMELPGFAQGGMVDQSGAGWDKGRGSSDWDKGRGDKDWDKGRGGDYGHTVVLNIGDKSHKLKGSKSTVDDLSREATDRQTSSSGSKPSWMK